MKPYLLLPALLIVGACVFSAFTVSPDQGGTAESIKRGAIIYEQFCLSCHQPNGVGLPGTHPPLIKTKYVLGNKKELVKIVLNGLSGPIKIGEETYENEMPPQNFLTDVQVADVLTYVRNNFGNKAVAVTAAEVKGVRSTLK